MGFFIGVKFKVDWWAQLKALGYDVIPIWGKDRPHKNWPKMPNDPAAISRWYGRGTGAAIRMYRSELLVIDFDVHDAAVRDRMLAWLNAHHPEFMRDCLYRHSERVTCALIGRCVTAKRTQKTARYIGAGAGEKGDLVEIFTGNSKPYIGVLGEHSRRRNYDFTGRSILEVRADALPWFPDSAIEPMRVAFEEIMAAHGWTKVIPVVGNDAIGTKVYDLEPGMIFTLSTGEKMTLEELEENYKGLVIYAEHNGGTGKVTGYADLWDATGNSKNSSTRVIVTLGAEGLCLFDTKYEVRHRWKSCAPAPDTLGEQIKEIMKSMAKQPEARR